MARSDDRLGHRSRRPAARRLWRSPAGRSPDDHHDHPAPTADDLDDRLSRLPAAHQGEDGRHDPGDDLDDLRDGHTGHHDHDDGRAVRPTRIGGVEAAATCTAIVNQPRSADGSVVVVYVDSSLSAVRHRPRTPLRGSSSVELATTNADLTPRFPSEWGTPPRRRRRRRGGRGDRPLHDLLHAVVRIVKRFRRGELQRHGQQRKPKDGATVLVDISSNELDAPVSLLRPLVCSPSAGPRRRGRAGNAIVGYDIDDATIGYKVVVDVSVGGVHCSTSFTPVA